MTISITTPEVPEKLQDSEVVLSVQGVSKKFCRDLKKSLFYGVQDITSEETGARGEWRDYQAVSLHGNICGAYFQENEQLLRWVNRQRLASVVTCLGDGHDGVWNLIGGIIPKSCRREVLDWYHLVENLYWVGGSLKRLQKVKELL